MNMETGVIWGLLLLLLLVLLLLLISLLSLLFLCLLLLLLLVLLGLLKVSSGDIHLDLMLHNGQHVHRLRQRFYAWFKHGW